MLSLIGISLFAVGVMSPPPDISGKWQGEDWGQIALTQSAPGHYTGTYTDTVVRDKGPGKIELKWSRIERRFNGTWREGEDRFGEISIRLADQEIRGALTTDAKSKINPATPRLADLAWMRAQPNGPGVQMPKEPSTTSPAAELKALQVRWKIVRVEEGKAADLSWTVFPYAYLGSPTFKPGMKPAIGDLLDFRNKRTMEIVTFSDGTDATFSYKIDPRSSPKTIDLLQPTPESQAKHRPGDKEYQEAVVALGIYEIDGDRLRICLTRYEPSVKSDQRPKTLTIDPNSGNTLFVLQRYRLSEDEQAMQGNWSITTLFDNGRPVPPTELDSPKGIRYSFFGNTAYPFIDVHIDSHRYSGAPYVLAPAKQPKAITISRYNAFVSPPEKREWLGIYRFEDDKLTIAYRQNGPRPEKFESTPGSGVTLLVLGKPNAEKAPGTVSTTGKANEAEAAWGRWNDGWGMRLRPDKATWTSSQSPEFTLELRRREAAAEDKGQKDLMLNLGIMLGNGGAAFPTAVHLVMTDSTGKARKLELSGPNIAGRVDDFVVPVAPGSSYSLRLRLADFWCPEMKEFRIALSPGEYRLQAVLESNAPQHANTGMRMDLMKVWKGTLATAPVAISLVQPGSKPEPPQKGSADLNALRQELAAASLRLHTIVDGNWRSYLEMPAEIYAGDRPPSAQSLQPTLAHFDAVARDPEYAALARRPEFRATHDWLSHYVAASKEAADGGPFDSPDKSRRKFNVAAQEEMSLVIGKMKGINWASVIISTQPQEGFGAAPLKTASVAVQATGGVPRDDDQVERIRYYVAASAGTKPENVTIADINGRVHRGGHADRGGPGGDPYKAGIKSESVPDTSAAFVKVKDLPDLDIAQAKYIAAQAKAKGDIDFRYAVAAANVAKAEYETHKKAVEKIPGSVPKERLLELSLKCTEMELAVELARLNKRLAGEEAKIAKAELDLALLRRGPASPHDLALAEARCNVEIAQARYNAAIAKAGDDIYLRYAAADAATRKAEYDIAAGLAQKSPGTVVKERLDELLLKCKEADLAIEKAKGNQRAAVEAERVAKAELEAAQRTAAAVQH
jgi:uncharacterized protein (TIGR03067 family)